MTEPCHRLITYCSCGMWVYLVSASLALPSARVALPFAHVAMPGSTCPLHATAKRVGTLQLPDAAKKKRISIVSYITFGILLLNIDRIAEL